MDSFRFVYIIDIISKLFFIPLKQQSTISLACYAYNDINVTTRNIISNQGFRLDYPHTRATYLIITFGLFASNTTEPVMPLYTIEQILYFKAVEESYFQNGFKSVTTFENSRTPYFNLIHPSQAIYGVIA